MSLVKGITHKFYLHPQDRHNQPSVLNPFHTIPYRIVYALNRKCTPPISESNHRGVIKINTNEMEKITNKEEGGGRR